ncbi:glycoside hydrolase family 5 protein [Xylona heveae TC161]|uniref:glucan 1,3-beta-glucosidase n=1 Tax=Xylona heveae (strain CBS 132557 / TC161) TaxID=1328760 RepID=A0A161TEW3_XYLHT|nr:glycoside hydrolase family 5 protein [Xylona heveae TC161]KZF24497.1 glycoside hydrolase family 5 protein [Xylona heveae TC161]
MFFSRLSLGKLAAVALLSPALVLTAPTLRLVNRDVSWDYNDGIVRGVNLGGWFVLEPWITPSMFPDDGSAVDEYTLSQILGGDAQTVLSNHWNSWITQDDFNQIAGAGLNHVRIPIGYWAIAPIAGDPYVQGQLDVLDQAIGWARDVGLRVIIDLHGGKVKHFTLDFQGDTVQQTLTAIRGLAERYANQADVVTGIELVNEPLGPVIDLDQLKQFYYDGWGTIRDSNTYTVVVIHDAFEQPVEFWNGFMNTQAGVNDVMLDTHAYQIFDDGQVAMDLSGHVSTACSFGTSEVSPTDKWTIVGEWTGAMTDCAKWLNGLGKGARYDGTFPGSTYVGSCDGKYTGTVAGLSDSDKANIRQYIEAQMDAYERRTGWFFWTWKTESAPEWHLQDLLGNGVFPQPLTDRQFLPICQR